MPATGIDGQHHAAERGWPSLARFRFYEIGRAVDDTTARDRFNGPCGGAGKAWRYARYGPSFAAPILTLGRAPSQLATQVEDRLRSILAD
jgi:hypothetical protein